MGKRKWTKSSRILLTFGAFIAVCTLYISLVPIQEPCNCEKENAVQNVNPNKLSDTSTESTKLRPIGKHPRNISILSIKPLHKYDDVKWGPHRLAVIVPFRDRLEELLEFAPQLHQFLNLQRVRHKIFVVNQVDILRFNRGSLINVGYQISQRECDYIAMHDVDLIPLNRDISYAMPKNGPFHVSAPDLHPRYHYSTFVGGILLLQNEHFRRVNGFSNRYFGWGKEDDEFYVRLKEANLTIQRPANITTGYSTFLHIHDKQKRPRDNKRYFDQKTKSRIRDRLTGLDTVLYEVLSRNDLEIDGAPVTILNVELRCDLNDTPWCVTIDIHNVIQEYLRSKDTLVPHDVYSKLSNGTYVKVNTTLAKPQPPMDLHYFTNIKLEKKFNNR